MSTTLQMLHEIYARYRFELSCEQDNSHLSIDDYTDLREAYIDRLESLLISIRGTERAEGVSLLSNSLVKDILKLIDELENALEQADFRKIEL